MPIGLNGVVILMPCKLSVGLSLRTIRLPQAKSISLLPGSKIRIRSLLCSVFGAHGVATLTVLRPSIPLFLVTILC